jgi:hypothetical protein
MATTTGLSSDDPRRLRELLARASSLASGHGLSSVVVGVAGREGDVVLPELLDFLESALRVDDSIFRLTRERAVLVVTDADRARAEEVVERVVRDFCSRFPVAEDPALRLGYFEVRPGAADVSVKHVLPLVFGANGGDAEA